jgi:hypothetical protein
MCELLHTSLVVQECFVGDGWPSQATCGLPRNLRRSSPPSPPAEKATARQDQTGKASTGDGSGDGRAPRAPVRADGTPSDPNHPWNAAAHREGTIIAALHLIDRRDGTILSTKV